mgnify:CR=1 FL=1
MHTSSSRRLMGRTTLEWFSSLPVFIMLMLTLVIGTGEMVHGQLLKIGESMFGDPETQVQYFMLRAEPVKPACNPSMDIDAEVQRQSVAPEAGAGDDIRELRRGQRRRCRRATGLCCRPASARPKGFQDGD